MGIEILGVDLGAASNLSIEFNETVEISGAAPAEWSDAFRGELEAAGIRDVGVSTRWSINEQDITRTDTRYYVSMKRVLPLAWDRQVPEDTPLMPLIRAAADVANRLVTDRIDILGSELHMTEQASILIDLPIEVSAPSAEDFQAWGMRINIAVAESGLARSTGAMMSHDAGEGARYFLILHQVSYQYDKGRLAGPHNHIRRATRIARGNEHERRII